MLTIVEFFSKKKINLKAIEKEQPELYLEFARDYGQMGEKSFDHSKKFWFNKLRKQYLLADEPVTLESKSPTINTAQNIENQTTAAKPTGFKPKFRAASTSSSPVIPEESNEAIVPSADHASNVSTNTKESTAAVSGFKPRFKASQVPQKTEETSDNPSVEPHVSTEEPGAANKPAGFKPRFKASQLPQKIEDINKIPVMREEDHSATEIPSITSTSIDQHSAHQSKETSANETNAKPLGFKPKIKNSIKTNPKNEGEMGTDEQL